MRPTPPLAVRNENTNPYCVNMHIRESAMASFTPRRIWICKCFPGTKSLDKLLLQDSCGCRHNSLNIDDGSPEEERGEPASLPGRCALARWPACGRGFGRSNASGAFLWDVLLPAASVGLHQNIKTVMGTNSEHDSLQKSKSSLLGRCASTAVGVSVNIRNQIYIITIRV